MILTLTTQRTISPFNRVKVDYLFIIPLQFHTLRFWKLQAILYYSSCFLFLFSKQFSSIANGEDMNLMSVGKWALYYQRYPVIQHFNVMPIFSPGVVNRATTYHAERRKREKGKNRIKEKRAEFCED